MQTTRIRVLRKMVDKRCALTQRERRVKMMLRAILVVTTGITETKLMVAEEVVVEVFFRDWFAASVNFVGSNI